MLYCVLQVYFPLILIIYIFISLSFIFCLFIQILQLIPINPVDPFVTFQILEFTIVKILQCFFTLLIPRFKLLYSTQFIRKDNFESFKEHLGNMYIVWQLQVFFDEWEFNMLHFNINFNTAFTCR